MIAGTVSSPPENTSLSGLKGLQLNMGVQCNVRCTMCFQTDFSPRFNMPPALYQERLTEAYPSVQHVKLLGGEPTIMKNCREAATFLRAYPNVTLDVTTNGVFIDDFWHETFLRQGFFVNVSINAATEATYDKIVILGRYKQVVANIKKLTHSRSGKALKICVSAVILKENVLEIAQLIELAADLGVDAVEFLMDPILSFSGLPPRSDVLAECARARAVQARTGLNVIGLDGFESHFTTSELVQGVAKLKSPTGDCKDMCTAPFQHLVIDWKGDVRVCANTWVKIGNLYNASLAEIWTGQKLRAYRNKLERGNYLWCAPNCGANANPSKLALPHKYAYQFHEDPHQFFRKVRQKVLQLRGKWVTVKNKKKPPSPTVAKAEEHEGLVQIQKAP
jgi:MoaA/NifB/PqqE/SkfB family radical SAM enzyme